MFGNFIDETSHELNHKRRKNEQIENVRAYGWKSAGIGRLTQSWRTKGIPSRASDCASVVFSVACFALRRPNGNDDGVGSCVVAHGVG